MRRSLWILALLMTSFCMPWGCAAWRGEKPVTEVEVRQEDHLFLDKIDTLAAHPLGKRQRRAAAEAQLALVKHLTGKGGQYEPHGPDAEPRYFLSDTTFTLPAGPPRLIRVQTVSELEKLAAKTGKDVFWFSITTMGTADKNGKRGIVLQYEYYVADWEQARWNALSDQEKAQRPTPKFRVFEYGGWGKFLAIREGTRMVLYAEPMLVS